MTIRSKIEEITTHKTTSGTYRCLLSKREIDLILQAVLTALPEKEEYHIDENTPDEVYSWNACLDTIKERLM
jgi:hypothetical protein